MSLPTRAGFEIRVPYQSLTWNCMVFVWRHESDSCLAESGAQWPSGTVPGPDRESHRMWLPGPGPGAVSSDVQTSLQCLVMIYFSFSGFGRKYWMQNGGTSRNFSEFFSINGEWKSSPASSFALCLFDGRRSCPSVCTVLLFSVFRTLNNARLQISANIYPLRRARRQLLQACWHLILGHTDEKNSSPTISLRINEGPKVTGEMILKNASEQPDISIPESKRKCAHPPARKARGVAV